MGRPPLRLGRPKGRPQAPFQPSHENRYPFTNWSTFAPPKWSKFTPPLTGEKKGYQHRIVFLSGRRKQASELLPRVHQAISLLKRWLLGTHQGAVSHEHLDYYLDEFVFRFNRRNSRSRGKLFYRLVQQAVAVDPTPYRSIVADWDAEAP